MNVDTLIRQLGTALPMMGAKNLVSGLNGELFFAIGRNPNGIKKLSISVAADDTYTVIAFKVQKHIWRAVSECEGVYADQLHTVLESMTGLYTRL